MSLLSRLIPGWRTEEAATRALAYVLDPEVSPGMARVFVNLLGPTGLSSFTLGRVEHGPTNADDSRPDVTILDADGRPRIFLKVTFWGGVDDRQATLLLGELPTDVPAGLVYVAPQERIPGLWHGLRVACEDDAGIAFSNQSTEEDGLAWARAGGRILLLTSWTQVLGGLRQATEDEAIKQDIIQLSGLTNRIEREAFPPLEATEVTDVGLAGRVVEYCRLVDKIAARFVSEPVANLTKPWSPGSYKSRRMVNRSMRVHGKFDLRLGVELAAWRDLGITPLWWVLTGAGAGDWERLKGGVADVRSYDGSLYIPISLSTGVEEDTVIRDALKRLHRVAGDLLEACRHE